jgi:hypothetical protein
MTLKWQHPFTCTVGGPTGCGKTQFIGKFLKHIHEMLDTKIVEIIWCYGISQKAHTEIKQQCSVPITFHSGLPDVSDLCSEEEETPLPRIIVIDDLMREITTETVDLFTRISHHRNISVFNCVQNIFFKGKGHRDMSLNSHYVVFFDNPRCRAQVAHFARQMAPEKWRYIVEAYKEATHENHGYLLFDLKQKTPEKYRIRSNIFPGETNYYYIPK